jgi:serine/threonine protein kinase
VWKARCVEANETIAIKDVMCTSDSTLREVKRECKFLQMLTSSLAVDGGSENSVAARVPQFLAAELNQIGANQWQVVLAMSRIPGEALDNYLTRRRCDELQQAAPDKERIPLLTRVSASCDLALHLVSQVAPVLERISDYICHRDLHPRNILIDVDKLTQGVRFGIVDFGLAVDCSDWRQWAWREENIAGDCRYFPPGSWLMFASGPQGLKGHNELLHEYRVRLDLHAFGVTLVQVLVGSIVEDSTNVLRDGSGTDKWNCLWMNLIKSWRAYWSHATYMWKEVFKAFQASDPSLLASLRNAHLKRPLNEGCADRLLALRASIFALRVAYNESLQTNANPRHRRALVLLDVLRILLCKSGCEESEANLYDEEMRHGSVATWRQVRLLVESISASLTSCLDSLPETLVDKENAFRSDSMTTSATGTPPSSRSVGSNSGFAGSPSSVH